MDGPPSRLSPLLDDASAQRVAAAVAPHLKPANGAREKWIDRIVVWGVGILLAWSALQVDVAVLKSQVAGQDKLLYEMRQDIKTLLQRVR